jgi:toxin ParE1/3/4
LPQVTKTVRAEQDLDEIWFYIALDNVEAADNLLDNVDSSCQLLAIQPRAGRLRPELAPELRSFPVGRYVVFYRPQDDGIDVVRVLHSARDIGSISEDGGFDENT